MSDIDKPNPQPVLEPNVVQQFLDNQAQELGIRKQEQEAKRIESENAHKYAMKLLDAQLVDRQRDRDLNKSNSNLGCIIIIVIGLAIMFSICYALHLGKDSLVKDFLQTLALVLGSGFGGYSIRVLKEKRENKPDS